jgi:hypothetical protein
MMSFVKVRDYIYILNYFCQNTLQFNHKDKIIVIKTLTKYTRSKKKYTRSKTAMSQLIH